MTQQAPVVAAQQDEPRSRGGATSRMRVVAQIVGSRLLQLVGLLFALSTVLFFLLRLSGDPTGVLAPENASAETIEQIRQQYGLDRSLATQYGLFLAQIVRLDFGASFFSGQDALGLVFDRLPATVELAGLAILTTVVIAIPVGTWLGASDRGVARRVGTAVVSVLQGTPGFVTGLVLIQLFAVWLGLLPSIAGSGPASAILPVLTLAAFLVPQLVRVLAAGTAEVMRQDYMRTARANGAAGGGLVLRHALPNAALSAAALIGSQFAALLSGALLTEYIFGWPGLGLLLVNAVSTLDFPVVQAAVFVVAVLVFAVNTVVDALFQVIDPRLRRKATS